MIKLLLLAVVPFMTEHRNVAPKTEVSTNFYGSVTGIVDNAYIQAHGGGGVNTNAVIDIVRDEIIPATNKLDQTLSDAIDKHVTDTNNPHAVTAEQVGALPLVKDKYGRKTAVTIGARAGKIGEHSLANGDGVAASGNYSHAEGFSTTASGNYSHANGIYATASGAGSHAEGFGTTAQGDSSHAEGFYSLTRSGDIYAFAWNGDNTRTTAYESHGLGTFNINPSGGLNGFWIGEQSLYAILTNKADKADIYTKSEVDAEINEKISGKQDLLNPGSDIHVNSIETDSASNFGNIIIKNNNGLAFSGVELSPNGPLERIGVLGFGGKTAFEQVNNLIGNSISATNPAFSNAVLAVGLNIDTNSVAVLNDIAENFGEFPLGAGETTTTVGGLLLALAAAVAWLKKNKVQTLKLNDNSVETSADGGVAKLDDFFTESNSLLNGRLSYSRNATGLKDRAFNTLSFDGTEYNLSTALAAVTPTASGQPRDLLIVATATAATTISFTAGTIKGDKPTIDGAGTWLITLTEYASGVWYCRQIKMEDAA